MVADVDGKMRIQFTRRSDYILVDEDEIENELNYENCGSAKGSNPKELVRMRGMSLVHERGCNDIMQQFIKGLELERDENNSFLQNPSLMETAGAAGVGLNPPLVNLSDEPI